MGSCAATRVAMDAATACGEVAVSGGSAIHIIEIKSCVADFRADQKWADYQDDYRAWSKIINFNSIDILGGEPMSNPDLPNWINGITELWPTVKKIGIVTNGTYLNKVAGFYDLLKKHNGKVVAEVNGHNAVNILQEIKNIEDSYIYLMGIKL